MCTNLWKIWKARNHCLFCHKAFEPHVVVDEALEYVLEFNKANPNLRSNKSLVQVAYLEPRFHSFNIIQEFISVELSIAKSLAIRWGLQIAKDLKLDKVLVQSDVMFVVDCINAFEFSIVLDNIVANW
ncbi:hypothetical protein KIW84_045446 [Lathyrus oleraceus]|uniref:RNase H type-1 domain-containing protein n=1 Tax=Pisum sativum TaxID=3888 RepID=A0A9D4XNU9_PEA|nr:hypothetical protein KIW84_045446 [Pisum sativum]